jgi:hypothetical protein
MMVVATDAAPESSSSDGVSPTFSLLAAYLTPERSSTIRSVSDDRALEVAEGLARWLDDRYLDPLIGLVLPGVGDLLTSALGLYPVVIVWRRGAPRALIARMLLNLAVDALGGSIPIVGDIWDFMFRANRRNLALLRVRAAGGQIRSRPTDTLVVVAAIVMLLVALAIPVVLAVAIVRALR